MNFADKISALVLMLVWLCGSAQAQIAGNAVKLTGSDFVRTFHDDLDYDQYIDTRNFTFELWFNASTPGVLVGEVDMFDTTKWDFVLAEVFTGGAVKVGVPGVPTITAGVISFDTWNHLAFSYSQTDRTLRAYLNGTPAGTSIGDRLSPRDIDRLACWTFGRGGPTNLGGGNWFQGKFDEIRFWLGALAPSKMSYDWNRFVEPNSPGLLMLIHFDTATGSETKNSANVVAGRAFHVPIAEPITLVPSDAPILPVRPELHLLPVVIGSGDSVSLTARVNPHGNATTVYFEWGPTINYGNATARQEIGNGTIEANVSDVLTNLARGLYHVRAIAEVEGNRFEASDISFMIPRASVQTLNAIVSSSTVTLRGMATPQAVSAEVSFEWGATSAYGNTTPIQQLSSGGNELGFSADLAGLPAGAYHYRAILKNQFERIVAEDRTFLWGGAGGKAVSLDGTDFVRTSLTSAKIFDSQNMTLEFWFKGSGPGVLVNEVDAFYTSYWDFAIAELLPTGEIVAAVVNDFNQPPILLHVGTVSFNSWNHLAIVYNNSTLSLSAYLNGSLSGTTVGRRRIPADSRREAYYAFGRGGPKNLGPGSSLSGAFDEVRIWRTALDANQISANWKRILTTDAPGLMALWRFDSANGDLSPDSRGAGDNPALHVPQGSLMRLTESTAPISATAPITTQMSPVSGNSAQLNGTLAAQISATQVYFEWGRTTNYGNTTLPIDFLAASGGDFSTIISNLSGGIHHYRAVGTSEGRFIFRGDDETFSVSGPTAQTLPAVISAASAYLRGVSNPSGIPTSVFFEWGKTREYGNFTKTNIIGNGAADVPVDEPLRNLEPGNYHFRVVAQFEGGRAEGNDQAFTISAPSVQTQAGAVNDGSVRLRGIVNPRGTLGSVYFQWGLSTNYGNNTPLQATGAGIVDIPFDEILDELPASVWHYRAVFTNSVQEVFGDDQMVDPIKPTVIDERPAITSNRVIGVNLFAVQLEAAVNPKGRFSTVYFEFGRSNNLDHLSTREIEPSYNSVRFTNLISNLEPGVFYDYRLIASNSFGISSINGQFSGGVAGEYAYNLDSGDYLRTGASQNGYFADKNITIELWFYPMKAGVIASETDFTPDHDRAIIEILPSGNVWAAFDGLPPIDVGTAAFACWNHVAIRYDAASQKMDGFLNGKRKSSAGIRVTPSERGFAGQFAFGRAANTRIATGEFFVGLMDDVRVWDIPRSNTDLTSADHNLLAGDETGLVLYWRGNAPESDPIVDSSPNNNAGINAGADIIISTAPLVFTSRLVSPVEIETQFLVKGGSSYTVESTLDLLNWTRLSTNTAPSSGFVRLPQTVRLQNRNEFFRVVSP